jgi:hypothetical protein
MEAEGRGENYLFLEPWSDEIRTIEELKRAQDGNAEYRHF